MTGNSCNGDNVQSWTTASSWEGKRQTDGAKTVADFFLQRIALVYHVIKRTLPFVCLLLSAVGGEAQVQVDLKFKRLQYIAYEPVVATLGITNLAGRDIELQDANGQSWLGFEVTGNEGQPIAPLNGENPQPPLKIEAGQRVTRQIDLAPLYPVHDFWRVSC